MAITATGIRADSGSFDQTVYSITELENASNYGKEGYAVYLSDGGRSGVFLWNYGDFAAEIASDPLQGVYVAGVGGAWVRKLDGFVTPEMFGAVGDFDRESEIGADDFNFLQAAINFHSTYKLELRLISNYLTGTELLVSGFVSINILNGFCIFGTGSGRGVVRVINNYEEVANFSSVGYLEFPSGTGNINTILNTSDSSSLSVGDVVLVKDSVDNAYSRSASPLAEIATVVSMDANVVYLDCRLRRQSGYASGSIFKLDKNTCSISGEIYGDKTTVRASALSILGYCDPIINLRCTGNSSAALLIHTCLSGRYSVVAKNLDNEPATNRLGYAVVKYGACKGGDVVVNAENVRHAYTDGVYSNQNIESGNVLDGRVSGVCLSATAAAWDTHPDSDGVVFNNIEAWQGHNNNLQPSKSLLYALQLRASNHTVNGLKTDLDRCIVIREVKHVDSIDYISNVFHNGGLIGSPSSDNRLFGVSYLLADSVSNPITQNAVSVYNFNNCNLHNITYSDNIETDNYTNCAFDWSQTTSGWPNYSGGGNHVFKDCTISNPNNMFLSNTFYISNTEINTDGDTFTLNDGASLTSINNSINCIGFSASNSSFCRTSIASGSVEYKYKSNSINDDSAEGVNIEFEDLSTGGTVTTKNIALNII